MIPPVSDDEITSYVLGELSRERSEEIERLARDDEDLSVMIALMRSLMAEASTAEEDAKPVAARFGRRSFALLGAAALLLLAGVGSLALRDRAEVSRLRTDNAHLSSRYDRDIQPTKTILEAAEKTDGDFHTIAFLPGLIPGVRPSAGTVDVTIQNATFPCVVKWKVGDQIRVVPVPVEGARLTLPSGEVRISCEAAHLHAWGQPFVTVHNEKSLGSVLGATILDLNDGDTLRLHLDQPYAPWNAAMIRIRGRWVMVTLERPWADYDVPKFQAGKFDGIEQWPNTPLFWAKEGSNGLAKELARYFVEHRAKNERAGRFRGVMHTGIIVPFDTKGVCDELRTMTSEELTPLLTEAFELLRKQRPPLGPTIQEEIDKAIKLQQGGLKPRPKNAK